MKQIIQLFTEIIAENKEECYNHIKLLSYMKLYDNRLKPNQYILSDMRARRR